MSNTITIGDRKFVPKGKLVDSLFKTGETADGEYRKLKGGIVFYAPNGEPRACLVINRSGTFFVTAYRAEGRIRYMFGLSQSSADFLGLPNSYAEQRELAQAIAERL